MKTISLPLLGALASIAGAVYWASLDAANDGVGGDDVIVQQVPEVRILNARRETRTESIRGYGQARARFRLQLTAEVSGRLDAIADEVESGNLVNADQSLFQIDTSRYRLAVEEAQRAFAEASLRLAEEKRQAKRSTAEWQSARLEGAPPPLVLGKPQIAAAKAAIAAAKAQLDNAERDLLRTQVHAPFPALVVSRMVSPGDNIVPGTPLAELASLDRVEIRVPLSDNQWAVLDQSNQGVVTVSNPDNDQRWTAYILRTERHVSSEDRQRALIVAVDKPIEQQPPLYPGTFVTVDLPSRPIADAYGLPASALSAQGEFWWVGADDIAQPFRPSAQYRFGDRIVVIPPEGMNDTQIIVKPLATLTPGSKVLPVAITPHMAIAAGVSEQ